LAIGDIQAARRAVLMNGRAMFARALGYPRSGEPGLSLAVVHRVDTAQPFAAVGRWNSGGGLAGGQHSGIDVKPSGNLAPTFPFTELLWISGCIEEPATAKAKVMPDLYGQLFP